MIAADILSFSNEQTRNGKLLWRLGWLQALGLSCFSLHGPIYGDQSTNPGTTSVYRRFVFHQLR